jgi:hypothetical protein
VQAQNNYIARKGGRPKKTVKINYALTVKCTIIEQKVIQRKAKEAGFTVSEYLRSIGLAGKIDRREKIIPKEILEYTAILNHMHANFNQVTRKVNCNQLLVDSDISILFEVPKQLKQHIENVTKYYQ